MVHGSYMFILRTIVGYQPMWGIVNIQKYSKWETCPSNDLEEICDFRQPLTFNLNLDSFNFLTN